MQYPYEMEYIDNKMYHEIDYEIEVNKNNKRTTNRLENDKKVIKFNIDSINPIINSSKNHISNLNEKKRKIGGK